jgi:hypothetical protein
MTSEARIAARMAIQAQLAESTLAKSDETRRAFASNAVSFSPRLFGLDRASPRRPGIAGDFAVRRHSDRRL